MSQVEGQPTWGRRTPEISGPPESGQYHDGWHPNCGGGLHIFHAVSDQDSLSQVHPILLMGTSEQAWRRLATVTTGIRQVWAAEHRLDLSTRPRNLLHHPRMDLLHRRPGHDPLGDARLVGYDQQAEPRLR